MAERFDFVDGDAQAIYNTVLDSLMESVNEPLYPGDERRIYAEALIMVLVSLYNDLNDTAKQRTLQHARGYVLDAIGEMRGAERLEATAAFDTFRFSVSAAQDNNIIIPAGTRVTGDGEIYWATDAAAVLEAGDLYVDVVAHCMASGSAYNNLAAGSISTLVDLIPYIATVSNQNGTAGGDDGEPYPWEDDGTGDERYRERIKLATAAYSNAGSKAAYRYFVLSADSNIIDVAVESPEGNEINIYPLMKGGEIPSAAQIAAIQAVFTDDVRPMTDVVEVEAPTQVSYNINIKYYCTVDNEVQAIQTVEAPGGAIDKFKEWQSGALGRDINPDKLRALILAPGDGTNAVDHVTITSPSAATITNDKVAKFSGTITVTHEIITG